MALYQAIRVMLTKRETTTKTMKDAEDKAIDNGRAGPLTPYGSRDGSALLHSAISTASSRRSLEPEVE